ncbi:MAG: carbamoyltransferase [Candidatus Rokubacteria bacterium]|nr:carbamoyltransferase [Candidatus Rokubacteria bacterium]
MNILGISCFYHDAAAALVRDGEVVAAAEEERFSRIKHDFSFPHRAIAFCLAQGGITSRDLDYVIFYEKPFVKFERILKTCLATFPRSRRVFREAMVVWLKDKLWVRTLIRQTLGVEPSKILFSEHHLSHAASAFYCSPFEEAAILTVDGVGEWTTASYGVGRDREISLLKEIHFPHSLGMLYSAFTAYLGFEVNEGEYKVMGMAPYGRPRYLDEVWRLIRMAPDGSFALDLDYFSYHYSPERTYNGRFEKMFGPPRPPSLHFFTRDTGFPSYFGPRPADYDRLAEMNQHYADVAASIQRVTEEVLLSMARHLRKETGMRRLCLAGGVALNSVANGRILRETGFEECYIQPAAGDGGGAVGAALYAYHALLGKPRQFVMEHAAWGQAWTPGEIREFLESRGIAHQEVGSEDELVNRTAGLLAGGKVVGWFQGRFEWGPRALGQRSILADPRRPEMKDIVNVKIKFREPYRPFAPSVLADRAAEYFDLPDADRHYPARFMLYVVDVRPEKTQAVPATTHVDGSARLQTVSSEWNPLYHQLIQRFGEVTGVPVVLNTSFNLKGEPIVASPADAFKTFASSGMDALALGPFIVRKESP